MARPESRFVRMALVILGAQTLLIHAVFFSPSGFLKAHAHVFYLMHYSLFLPLFFTSRDRCAFLFSPSFLIVSYFCLSFTIGGYAFSQGYVLLPDQLRTFHRWDHFRFAMTYFMACNLCAVLAYLLARRGQTRRPVYRVGDSLCRYTPQLVIGGVLLTVFSLVNIELGFLGGSGDFSIGPRTFGFLVIAIVLVKTRWRYRFPAYIGLLSLFAATEYLNRRIALLLGLSVIFMEVAHLQHLRVSLRRVLICAVILTLAAVLLMTMTVARGLDGFEGSYWQTFRHLDSFAKLDNAAAYSLKTTEGPTMFFHAHNAIHYILEDSSLLCHGSTLAKVFFIPIPRSIWPNKPQSMVHIYTSRWNPAFRSRGGSTGINAYAEYFWNFHVLGILCVVPIFYCLNRVFFFYLSRLRVGNVWPFIYLGVGQNSLLMYGRGHGLYNLANDVVIAFAVQVVLFYPLVSLLRATKHRGVPSRTLSLQEQH